MYAWEDNLLVNVPPINSSRGNPQACHNMMQVLEEHHGQVYLSIEKLHS